MQPVQPVQKNIYQNNTYREHLIGLHFDNEPRIQERQQYSCIHARPYGRFTEIQSNLRRKKLQRTNQDSHFLGDSFSNRYNVRAPV